MKLCNSFEKFALSMKDVEENLKREYKLHKRTKSKACFPLGKAAMNARGYPSSLDFIASYLGKELLMESSGLMIMAHTYMTHRSWTTQYWQK